MSASSRSDSFPAGVRSPADLRAVEALATRVEVQAGAGRTMVWRSWGSGAPIVLFHGGAGSWTHWVRNIGALVAAGRQVWAPDLPGFGESMAPARGHDADAMPDPVEACLRSLLGDTVCDLVGFSFGGMVATLVAAAHPARVRRLVLVGAPGLGVRGMRQLELQRWRHLETDAEREAVHRSNLSILMLADPASIDDVAVALHAANVARDRMPMRKLSRTAIVKETLPGLRCPVYGIWGRRDALYVGVEDRLAPVLAGAPDFRGLTLIPDAGHWVQFERAGAFNRALAAAVGDDASAWA